MAAVTPPPAPEPSAPPPSNSAVAATVAFASQSAELNDAARTDLDRLAKNLGDRSLRQIEIRAYAGGSGDPDSRKISLARALVVRSYLIDRGVKARIEVGAYGGNSRGGGSERVDILVPNS
jgi:outer membrane protein OmpA-like peptidoglycan-associated protein